VLDSRNEGPNCTLPYDDAERAREQPRQEDVMSIKTKRTLVGALSAALVITSFSMAAPVRAAPVNKTPAAAPAADTMPTDVSARRRHYRNGGISAGQAAAMFGIVAGTVLAVSAARRHRHYKGVPYYGGVPYGGYYGYGAPYAPYGGYYGYGPRYPYW
jgi:hypothetical protein